QTRHEAMKTNQLAKGPALETAYEGQRLSRRISRKPAAMRWPHRRRAMAVAISDETAADTESGLQLFLNEHAVKSGIVLFWAWYGVANWHAIGRLLHIGLN